MAQSREDGFLVGMRAAIMIALIAAPVILKPGDREIANGHLGNATRTLRMMKGDSEIARFRYQWQIVPQGGLLLVVSGHVREKPFVDSSLVKRQGLAPVWEVARFGSKIDRWTYDGQRVNQHTYGVSVFSFQELDDLLRSLPLRAGYERILPLYSEGDDSVEMDTVRIMSRSTAGRWTLRFADPAIVATYDVDERTRQIVRHEFVLRRDGTHFLYLDSPDTSTSSAPPA
jgi:hypothetical protein